MKQMRTQHKCFSQDTKACPDPRSLHCAHMSRATCCVTPPLTLPRHVIRPWAHFSLQCVPRRLTKLSDSWSHPEHSMWSFYDIREVKGHDHFSSTISHILEKCNSCRSFYLFIVLFSDHCLYWIRSLRFYEEADLLHTDLHSQQQNMIN